MAENPMPTFDPNIPQPLDPLAALNRSKSACNLKNCTVWLADGGSDISWHGGLAKETLDAGASLDTILTVEFSERPYIHKFRFKLERNEH
jgi:hypothetical protein